MKALRLTAGAAVLALLTTSCGDDSSAPEPTARDAENTTATSSRLEAPAFEDRSLLSLLPSVERLGAGAFQVMAAEDLEGTHLAANVSGWFWTTDGGVYTRVDIDRDVIDGHVDDVLNRPDRQTIEPAASDLLYLQDDYYRGDEFQFGIGHLLVRLGFASPSPALEGGLVEECGAALEVLEAAVLDHAAALEPTFAPAGDGEVWEFPLDELSRRTTTEQARVNDVCAATSSDDEYVPARRLRFERSGDSLDVIIDPGIYTEPVDVVALSFHVEPAAEAPAPPAEPHLADGFDLVSVFTMKISECGALPWEYSNFAAGNTYRPPDGNDYLGPSFFVSDYLCESELPDDLNER